MAAELPPVVVDTNIIFSALLREPNRFAETIVLSGHRFYVCETVLVELFRRKEKILRLSQLRDDELARVYHILLRRLQLEKEELIAEEHWRRARDLCRDVDETDTPHVALTLHLAGVLWTGDRKLRSGLEAKGFDRFFT